MKIGVIADDFTGASDVALALTEAGMTTALFTGVPDIAADPSLGAGVVALKSRTAPVRAAVRDSLAACAWLQSQGAAQIVLKVCSTFDSTPEGNIGPVLDALMDRLDPGPVMVCPAFPETGRSVYQGHLFVGDALLSESGMQDHPLTPMTDPDLRRVLDAQSRHPVGHVPIDVVMRGATAIQNALPAKGPVILDAIRNEDLYDIAAAADGAALLCGGSGIVLGLPANFGMAPATPGWPGRPGPGVVLSGSCARATRAQVRHFAATRAAVEITADAAVSDAVDVDAMAQWVLKQSRPPLIYTSADPDTVAAAQAKHGQAVAAQAIERLFGRIARALVAAGVTRMVVAGGETSGAVVTALGLRELRLGPRLAAGVPIVHTPDLGLALALKSGNFGAPDFFDTALASMRSASI